MRMGEQYGGDMAQNQTFNNGQGFSPGTGLKQRDKDIYGLEDDRFGPSQFDVRGGNHDQLSDGEGGYNKGFNGKRKIQPQVLNEVRDYKNLDNLVETEYKLGRDDGLYDPYLLKANNDDNKNGLNSKNGRNGKTENEIKYLAKDPVYAYEEDKIPLKGKEKLRKELAELIVLKQKIDDRKKQLLEQVTFFIPIHIFNLIYAEKNFKRGFSKRVYEQQ